MRTKGLDITDTKVVICINLSRVVSLADEIDNGI